MLKKERFNAPTTTNEVHHNPAVWGDDHWVRRRCVLKYLKPAYYVPYWAHKMPEYRPKVVRYSQ